MDGKLGYLGYNRGLFFDIQANANPILVPPTQFFFFQQQIPVDGVWVGASVGGGRGGGSFAAFDPDSPLCLTLTGSWLFPNNKEGSETSFSALPLTAEFRTWKPNTQWYTIDVAASRCGWSTFSLIGGFRYDSFSTSFSNPMALSVLGVNTSAAEEAELVLTSYIPYLGGVATWGPVTARLIGFPWVQGNVAYNETVASFRGQSTGNYRNSYFFEASAEVGGQMGVVHLSGFATYTVLHAVGDLDVSFGGSPSIFLPVFQPSTFGFGLDRQNWIAGGKAVVGFNSPL